MLIELQKQQPVVTFCFGKKYDSLHDLCLQHIIQYAALMCALLRPSWITYQITLRKKVEWKQGFPIHSPQWPKMHFYFEFANNSILAAALLWIAKTSFVFALLFSPLNAQMKESSKFTLPSVERCWAVKRLWLDMIHLPLRKKKKSIIECYSKVTE